MKPVYHSQLPLKSIPDVQSPLTRIKRDFRDLLKDLRKMGTPFRKGKNDWGYRESGASICEDPITRDWNVFGLILGDEEDEFGIRRLDSSEFLDSCEVGRVVGTIHTHPPDSMYRCGAFASPSDIVVNTYVFKTDWFAVVSVPPNPRIVTCYWNLSEMRRRTHYLGFDRGSLERMSRGDTSRSLYAWILSDSPEGAIRKSREDLGMKISTGKF